MKFLKTLGIGALCAVCVIAICDLSVIAWDYTMSDEWLIRCLNEDPDNKELQRIAHDRGLVVDHCDFE